MSHLSRFFSLRRLAALLLLGASMAAVSLTSDATSRETVVVRGASHAVMVSHPRDVATLIERAAEAR